MDNTCKVSTYEMGAVIRGGAVSEETMTVQGSYTMTCVGPDGQVKWSEEFDNLVTTEGKNHLLDWGLAGTASAIAIRMSLITSGTPVAGDTYASHGGFTELSSGVVAARGTPSLGSAASGTKSTSSAVAFSIIGTGTITGAALNLVAGTVGNLGVVGDTATSNAKLYSAGLFSVSKSVSNGDTLNVTYSSTLT